MTKHIQAYFKERDNAESAATSLRALGAEDVTTDRTQVDTFEEDMGMVFPPTASVDEPSFTGPPLVSLDPVSTPAYGVGEEPGVSTNQEDDVSLAGTPVLSAAVDDALYDEAINIVRQKGGTTDPRGVS
ncbi:hypothetical protein [Paenibacillus thermotolerans]|uniref:hypothetical protein n=1 Tax=Paenibacillus thermotolerans TaxID=3027807 RepID=UPI002367A81E|nr:MULTISPECIES: hypothetical protein [unclassified Paenibacillus]